ncbi:MAG TPA: hypothetical protein VH008_10220 [Pseudonocardia sp.]|jgi:hypothetical protein|nr:hypothetical protein [Pseudonocardia sp.]
MKFRVKARQIPIRLATGAFILNSGLHKRHADEETAAQLHGLTAGTYPVAHNVDPATFVKVVSTGEIALGAALLLPFVPGLLAGAGLAAFSAGLLGLYLRTPGMREEGSLRPTPQGIPIAKDVWMLGAGLSMVVDALTDRSAKS